MATSWLLRIILLLTTMTSPSTNLISLPFSHPTCDRHDVKKILVHGDEPHKFSVTFLFWLRINLLLTIHDVAVDKFDFSPVQSPDMRSSRCKKILVQGDEPQKAERQMFILG